MCVDVYVQCEVSGRIPDIGGTPMLRGLGYTLSSVIQYGVSVECLSKST